MPAQIENQPLDLTPGETDNAPGKVIGTIELRPVLVKMRDGHGQEMVKIVLVVPGGEVYFVNEKALEVKPAQQWAKKQILESLSKNFGI